ncbi:UDP-N-acetylmuramate dehydrogenase [Brevinema andersonii]|uniref:UDP-N-acetylenolpyruvoylglucosamine reductase n=1 Tax=Brevinema andersonii TaxID=34097 RepID=A0A1I1DPH2_BREAD|nr:UDP-N-acetylmuramate dehydrogenase [Brevinema andersonii]SFB74453.1 UDP-N-acetylmuramate dehydrogenase [Brevinema andersonii]
MLDSDKFCQILHRFLPDLDVKKEAFLSQYTTMQVGGSAKLMVFPCNKKQCCLLFSYLIQENIPYFILGRGSNIIVNDHGVNAVIINTQYLDWFAVDTADPYCITAGTGLELKDLSVKAQQLGLSGLEFTCGIPGSVGGAIFMNAGAYEEEIKNVLISSLVLHPKHGISMYSNKDHQFGYRHSIFAHEPCMILEAQFKLMPLASEEIIKKMKILTQKREDKQPLSLPSSGSVFKRPEGFFAGKLIADAGLQGFRIGGAKVSKKHAGFIINTGNATAQDVINLVCHIQQKVYEKFNVKLEPEIKFLEPDLTFRTFSF